MSGPILRIKAKETLDGLHRRGANHRRGFLVMKVARRADEMFGLERLTDILRRDCDLPAEQMIRRLHAEITDFIGDLAPQDDCTIVVIRRQ